MSGKQGKREAKLAKEAQRQEARRRQRQQTIFTGIVIAIILVIGGVVIAVSLGDPGDEVAEAPTDLPTDLPTGGPTEDPLAGIEPCVPEPAPEGVGEEKETYEEAPTAELEEATDYRAVVTTTCGEFTIDLYEDRAPIAVGNFIGLVEDGFYDNLAFFRNARSIYALQTGAGTNEATFDIGYTFEDELAAAEEEGYTAGSLAMANSGPGTNGSQVFLTYGDAGLPAAYTKFGQVTEGLDVLKSIGAIPNANSEDPMAEEPSETVYITSVTIESGPATDDGASDAPTGEAPADETTEEPTS